MPDELTAPVEFGDEHIVIVVLAAVERVDRVFAPGLLADTGDVHVTIRVGNVHVARIIQHAAVECAPGRGVLHRLRLGANGK